MKLCLTAFLATFAIGIAALLTAEALSSAPPAGGGKAASSTAKTDIGVYDTPNPLRLPNAAFATPGAKEGWEYSGTVNANFVSSRAQLESWSLNQGWTPQNKITLDESLDPKVILTFKRGKEEMTMLIWKISTNSTGFAYKRESPTEKRQIK